MPHLLQVSPPRAKGRAAACVQCAHSSVAHQHLSAGCALTLVCTRKVHGRGMRVVNALCAFTHTIYSINGSFTCHLPRAGPRVTCTCRCSALFYCYLLLNGWLPSPRARPQVHGRHARVLPCRCSVRFHLIIHSIHGLITCHSLPRAGPWATCTCRRSVGFCRYLLFSRRAPRARTQVHGRHARGKCSVRTPAIYSINGSFACHLPRAGPWVTCTCISRCWTRCSHRRACRPSTRAACSR